MPRALSEADVGAFRERLIDAAERLFAEHGVDAVTMRQLAAALGVSPMTPYRYFADKDAILAAARARGFARHADLLERAYAEAKGSPFEKSAAVGEAYLAFAFENPNTYKLMFDFNQPNEGAYPELVAAGDRSRATMTRHLEAMVATGRFKGDPTLVGHVYWSAIHGAIMLEFSRKLMPGYDARRLIAATVAALNHAYFGAPLRG